MRGFNSRGQVVGAAPILGSGPRAFVLTQDALKAIEGFPGTDWSAALSINEDGVVVGSANTSTTVRAFRWMPNGGIKVLAPLLGDTGSEAFGINQRGQAVGSSSGPGGIQAVLWAADGSIQDLGMILAIGSEHHAAVPQAGGEHQHALPLRIVLLVPVP